MSKLSPTLATLAAVQAERDMMPLDKWARHQDRTKAHFEDRRTRSDNVEEVLRGLKEHRRGAPMGILERHSQYGRTIDLVGDGIDTSKTILNLVGDDEMARVISVHLMQLRPRDPLTTQLSPVRGQLEFGAGGVQAFAEIDWLQGTTFTVACSFLRLSAFIELTGFKGASVQTTVGAFASYGSVATVGARTPQLTDGAEIDAGNVVNLQIPLFAQSVQVVRQGVGVGAAAEPFGVIYFDGTAAEAYRQNFAADENMPITPLSNDARILQVRNAGVNNGVDFRIIWYLAL